MKKLSLGEGGAKALLAKHVEKVAFGVCLLIVVLFLYTGFKLQGYEKVPQEIKELAGNVRNHIEDDSSWERLKEEESRLRLTNYSEAVQEGNVATPGGLYPYTQPLKPPDAPPQVKRTDPKLFAPMKVIARPFYASIGVVNDSGLIDKLAEQEDAKVEATKVAKRDSSSSRRNRGGDYESDDDFSSGFDFGGDEDDRGGGFAPPSGAPGMGDGGASMFSGSSGGVRMLKNAVGWRPGGGGFSMGPDMMAPSGPTPGNIPGATGSAGKIIHQPQNIVVVLWLVPYEKQRDEYKHIFENAMGYEPMRDRPNYVSFVVERAEIPADPNAAVEWTKIGSLVTAMQDMKKWAGSYEEVANPLYTLPNTSLPIPPILMRDIEELVDHPDIPKKSAQVQQQTPTDQQPTQEQPDLEGDVLPRGFRAGNQAPGGFNQFSGDGRGFSGSGPPGMTGPQSGVPGLAAGAGGGGPGAAGLGPEDFGSGPGGFSPMGPGMQSPGMGSGLGGAPGMAGMGSYATQEMVTEYKLGRYFDFTADPSKQYQYRVQLLIEDPNHPENPAMDPLPRMLSDEASARVAELQNKEPANQRRTQYYRRTDFSEPSETVQFPPRSSFYVGGPEKSTFAVHKNGAQLHRDWMTNKVAPVVWDPDWGVHMALDKDVYIGGTMNAKGDIEVPHPLTLTFKKIKDYDFRGDIIIADIRGGEVVGGERTEPLYSPTECAAVDAFGRLVIRNEIDDLELYRRYAYIEETTNTSGTGMDGGAPAGMMGPGDPAGAVGGGGTGPTMTGPSSGPGGGGRGRGRR